MMMAVMKTMKTMKTMMKKMAMVDNIDGNDNSDGVINLKIQFHVVNGCGSWLSTPVIRPCTMAHHYESSLWLITMALDKRVREKILVCANALPLCKDGVGAPHQETSRLKINTGGISLYSS